MLKNYELLYILHPDLEGSSDKISEKVTSFITKAGGEVTNQEDWGKRKLAYPIAKNDFGVYVLVYFTLESAKLPDVEHDLRLSEEVMRFMVVQLPEVIETKKESKAKKPARAEDRSGGEAKAPAKAEKPAKEEKKEEAPVAEEVKEEKPKTVSKETEKKTTKKAKEEVVEEPSDSAKASTDKKAEEKPASSEGEKPKATKSKVKSQKSESTEETEKERLKKLDEKLEEILGE